MATPTKVSPYEHQKIWFEHARQFTRNSTIYNSRPKDTIDNKVELMPGIQPRKGLEYPIVSAKWDTGVIRQTRLESALESTVNIATGFVVSYGVWVYVIPLIWYEVDPGNARQAFLLTCVFTVSSFARSYIWRRFFNANLNRRIHQWLT